MMKWKVWKVKKKCTNLYAEKEDKNRLMMYKGRKEENESVKIKKKCENM